MISKPGGLILRANSRLALRVFVLVAAIILMPAVILRVQAIIFEKQAVKLLSAMANLRIGQTTRADAVGRLPGLSPPRRADRDCKADECLFTRIAASRFSFWLLSRIHNETIFTLVTWWGVRYWSVDAYVELRSDTVSNFSYTLILSSPQAYLVPGALRISASSSPRFPVAELDWLADESPDFYVRHYFKWPDADTRVYFQPYARPELVKHAFDADLSCVWSLAGCQTSRQVLWRTEADWSRVTQSAINRMNGPNQCPTSLLPRRARDARDILLVRVEKATATIAPGDSYHRATFRLLRVLKGKAERPLENLGVSPTLDVGGTEVANSAVDLLYPGARVLLFSGASLYIDEACEAMLGSDKAIKVVKEALASPETQ